MSDVLIVDDQDSNILYTGHWGLVSREPDYSQTASSGSSGATMTFTFSGSSIAAVGDLYAGGTCNGTFSIDGTTADFSSPVMNGVRYQQTLWTSPNLSDDNHTFVYTASSCNPSGSFVWIDYLLYNSSTVTNSTGATYFFDDRDPRLVYSAQANSTTGIDDFRGTITGVEHGDSLSFEFNGTSVQVFGRLDNGTAGGLTQAQFSVDKAPAVTFTSVTSSNISHNKPLYASRPLNPGHHSLFVNNSGEVTLWIDYILVHGQSIIANPSPSASNVSDPGSGSAIKTIVGSVVGGFVFFAIVATAILFYCRRQKRLSDRVNRAKLSDTVEQPKLPTYQYSVPPNSPYTRMTTSSIELHRIPHRRQPYSQSSDNSTTNLTHSDLAVESTELGYVDNYIGSPLRPAASREGSINTLPNPHSVISRHRSYQSESSLTHSTTTHLTRYDDVPPSPQHPPPSPAYSIQRVPSTAYSISTLTHADSAMPRLRSATIGEHEDEHLTAALERKRRQDLVVLSVSGMSSTQGSSAPLMHTDSGLRLYLDPELEPELPPLYSAE